MSAYPNASPFGTPLRAASGNLTRQRSSIGRWFKTAVDVDTDPGTLALAAYLTKRYGGLAVTIATGIRTRLVAFMARDRDNDDGNVRRYDAPVLETLVAWPGKPGTLLPVLESVGITVDGRIRHWHDLVGNPSPADRRRMTDRDRQRRHRARTAESVTRDTVTKRDSSVTSTVTAAPTYKERAHARTHGVGKETHTQRDALRATTEPRPEVTGQPTASATLPEAVGILADIWTGPVPASVTRRIVQEVRDIERWRRTVATWQSAGWHIGAGAVGAMLHRYRQDADGKRSKLALSAPRPGVRAKVDALSAAPAQVVPTHSPGTPPPTIVPPLPKPATPESRAAFARAFAGSPFRLSHATRTPRSQTDPRPPTATRAVPDLRSLPPDQRAVVALAALQSIGRTVTQATAAR